jgi:GNAT superfamily N-acetyltransferase
MHHVRLRPRASFTPDELEQLTRWLEVAYDDPPGDWRGEHWDDLSPGPHFVIEQPNGDLLAHACIAWVTVQIGATSLRAGYLEDVATRADARGRGLGSTVVAAAQSVIEAQADIGLLATGSRRFYERRRDMNKPPDVSPGASVLRSCVD